MKETIAIPKEEYPDFYSGYIEKSQGVPPVEGLVSGFHNLLKYLRKLPKNHWDYRYAEGKWSIKEIILHLIDSERVFAYRALMMVRSDHPQLRGFDQDEFVHHSRASHRSPNSLIDEFYTLRKATIVQFSQYDEKQLLKKGSVEGAVVSVRALAAIIHGHSEHHLSILKERYS